MTVPVPRGWVPLPARAFRGGSLPSGCSWCDSILRQIERERDAWGDRAASALAWLATRWHWAVWRASDLLARDDGPDFGFRIAPKWGEEGGGWYVYARVRGPDRARNAALWAFAFALRAGFRAGPPVAPWPVVSPFGAQAAPTEGDAYDLIGASRSLLERLASPDGLAAAFDGLVDTPRCQSLLDALTPGLELRGVSRGLFLPWACYEAFGLPSSARPFSRVDGILPC